MFSLYSLNIYDRVFKLTSKLKQFRGFVLKYISISAPKKNKEGEMSFRDKKKQPYSCCFIINIIAIEFCKLNQKIRKKIASGVIQKV